MQPKFLCSDNPGKAVSLSFVAPDGVVVVCSLPIRLTGVPCQRRYTRNTSITLVMFMNGQIMLYSNFENKNFS